MKILDRALHQFENFAFSGFMGEELTEKTQELVNKITHKRDLERGSIRALEEFLTPLYRAMEISKDRLTSQQIEELQECIHITKKEIERLKNIEELRASFVDYTRAVITTIMKSHPKQKK